MKIFHKDSCITCKKTISQLDRMKVDLEKRDFFKEPFSESELKKILKLAGKKPSEMIRKRDKMFKELNFEQKNYSESKIIKFMIKYPGLIQRPIIISKNKVHIGKIDPKKIQDYSSFSLRNIRTASR